MINRNKPIMHLFIALIIICFISCSNETNNNRDTDSSSNGTWKIEASETSKTITGVYGKNIYAVRFNPTDTKIAKENNRIISPIDGVRSIEADEAIQEIALEESTDSFCKSMPIITPKDLGLTVNKDTDNSRDIETTSITRIVDETTQAIYVNDESEDFTEKTGTVRAVGTYCTAWTIEGYHGTEANQISTDEAESLVAAFDELYPYITNVSGKETNQIYMATGSDSVELTDLEDTKVNLVFFDIFRPDIVGYFASQDNIDLNGYTPPTGFEFLSYSNKGKYLYIDTKFIKQSIGSSFSTIAHEFQHMIDYNQKTIIMRQGARFVYRRNVCHVMRRYDEG